MTVIEVAQRIGVHEMTARRWCVAGRIPATKVGRAWLIPRVWLNETLGKANLPTGL